MRYIQIGQYYEISHFEIDLPILYMLIHSVVNVLIVITCQNIIMRLLLNKN